MKLRAALSFGVTSAAIAAVLLTAAIAEGEVALHWPGDQTQSLSATR